MTKIEQLTTFVNWLRTQMEKCGGDKAGYIDQYSRFGEENAVAIYEHDLNTLRRHEAELLAELDK